MRSTRVAIEHPKGVLVERLLAVGICVLADIYRRARERGADHPHAVRILGRAWVRVLWRCWVDEMPYDPACHGGLSRLQPGEG